MREEEGAGEEELTVAAVEGKSKLTWRIFANMLVLDGPDIKPSPKIASLDLDHTLIKPKSGRTFPIGRADWKWWSAEVPTMLKRLHEDGYKLVVFSNQTGIAKGKTQARFIRGKILDVIGELRLPMQAFVATTEGKWCKPSPAVWRHFAEHHNGGVEVDMKQSFYCGDEAGRALAWDGDANTRGDYSVSDRKFALNLGLPFKTPEMLFLGHEDVGFEWRSIDPTTIPAGGTAFEGEVTSDSQEMIIFVGFPTSGKSTFAKRYLVPEGYFHINQGTTLSRIGGLKAARAAVAEGMSVVIDNANPTAAGRAEYIMIAEDAGIPVRCFVFQTPLELAQHMNLYRENVFGVQRVSAVQFNVYKNTLEPPHISEGFAEVKRIRFVPHFDDPETEKDFYLFT